MRLFSTEQVSKYHPDKYAAQVAPPFGIIAPIWCRGKKNKEPTP